MTSPLPDDPPAWTEVCAVVITYHPDRGFPGRLRRVLSQVGGTVIVDNGSPNEALRMLEASSAAAESTTAPTSPASPTLAAAPAPGSVPTSICAPAVTLVAHVENLGIARALNAGVQHAIAHGYAWALLLDQDTEVDPHLVQALLVTQASYPTTQRAAVIGSRFRDTHGRPADTIRLASQGELWQEVESVITSGTLLSLAAYSAIGPFRDEFFIDYVDTEYCFRARAAGYMVIETRQALMSHTVGAPTQHQVLGQQKWTTNHSADRRYYIARNNTVLLREYGTSSGSWRWKSIVRSFRLCKRIALFERDKFAKIIAVGEGWWDGMRGNLGPRHRPVKSAAAGRQSAAKP